MPTIPKDKNDFDGLKNAALTYDGDTYIVSYSKYKKDGDAYDGYMNVGRVKEVFADDKQDDAVSKLKEIVASKGYLAGWDEDEVIVHS